MSEIQIPSFSPILRKILAVSTIYAVPIPSHALVHCSTYISSILPSSCIPFQRSTSLSRSFRRCCWSSLGKCTPSLFESTLFPWPAVLHKLGALPKTWETDPCVPVSQSNCKGRRKPPFQLRNGAKSTKPLPHCCSAKRATLGMAPQQNVDCMIQPQVRLLGAVRC